MILKLKDTTVRSGSMPGYAVNGWDYEGGWLVKLSPPGNPSERTMWVSSRTAFDDLPNSTPAGEGTIEILPKPLELPDSEKAHILDLIWHWEIWEPTLKEGTCLVQCLARAIDLADDDIVDMFRRALRDPRTVEDTILTLGENGYKATQFDPDGFGRYRDRRRLVTMTQTSDSTQGHVVLIYENDADVFDSSNTFKKVDDLLSAPMRGYRIDHILVIDGPRHSQSSSALAR